MQWLGLLGLLAVPLYLLLIVIHRLRLSTAIVAPIQLATILFAISLVISVLPLAIQDPSVFFWSAFLSVVVGAGAALLLMLAFLRLARLNQPSDEPDSRESFDAQGPIS